MISPILIGSKYSGNGNGANQSVQGRAKAAPWEPTTGTGLIPDSFLVMLGQVADELPGWTVYPQLRDAALREFVRRSDGALGSAVNTMQSKLRSLAYKVNAPGPRTKKRFSDLLGYSEFGEGFASLLGKTATDLYTQDNGWFIEKIGAGKPDRPLKGPVMQLAHLDSARCWRTFDPEFPVLYTNPYTGQFHKIHASRLISGSSWAQADELARGIGFCAVSRALRGAQIARDIAVYKHEKLSGRFTRAIGYGSGYTPGQLDNAFAQAAAANDNRGFTRFSLIPWVLSQQEHAALAILDLASLPDGYDSMTEQTLWIYLLALAFGTDAREFWPSTQSGATRADATVQDQKARGKGFAEDVKAIEHAINWNVFPDGVELEFDNKDDEQDKRVADMHGVYITNVKTMQDAGDITPQEGRAILIDKGVIDPTVLQTAQAPVLADDSAPVDLAPEEIASPLPEPSPTPELASQNSERQGVPTGQKALTLSNPSGPMRIGAKAAPVEKKTEQYQAKLRKLMATLQAELNDADTMAEADDAVDTFAADYKKLASTALTAAFGIGLAGKQPTDAGLAKLRAIVESDSSYFEDSFLPDLRKTVHEGLGVEDMALLLAAFSPRLVSYSGDYWHSIWAGAGDQMAQETRPIRVRRVLDVNAQNCPDCPPICHEYESFEEMEATVGIPGDGSTQCLGNCRCTLEFEQEDGSFAPLVGKPTVFTRPLVEVP